MKKKVLKIYAYILIIGGVYALWGLLTGKFIPCFYRLTTGFECPGCGITRMFISMFKLDFVSAFHYNPFMFVMFFFWNAIGILCMFDKVKFVQRPRFLYTCFYISLGLMVIFTFYRIFIGLANFFA